VNNTIIGGAGITVGGGSSPLPPLGCLIANNRFQDAPAAVVDNGEGTRVEGNATAPAAPGRGAAPGGITSRPLTEADVGPDAP
jgi:hypothetical protein